MWYLDKRVQVICDELKKLITVKTMKFDKIRYKEGLFFYPREAPVSYTHLTLPTIA